MKGGAAGSAVAADEEEAFGTAANWEDVGKGRGGETQNNPSKHIYSWEDSDLSARRHAVTRQQVSSQEILKTVYCSNLILSSSANDKVCVLKNFFE